MSDCTQLACLQCFNADGFAFQGQEFNLVSSTVSMYMHHYPNIAGFHVLRGQVFG